MKGYHAFTLCLQVLACVLFMSFPLLFLGNDPNATPFNLVGNWSYWLFSLSFITLYCLNAYVLIPRFFKRKRYLLYGACACLLLMVFYYLKPFDRLIRESRHSPAPDESVMTMTPGLMPPPRHPMPPLSGHPTEMRLDITTIYIFVMVMALSTASRMVGFWVNSEKRMSEVEKDKVRAELAFLKAQVHPHFLFNTLNNIYTLATINHAKTAESILRLSNIMRYFTDEAQRTFVPLKEEADCIKNYIALQELRLPANNELHINLDDIDPELEIAPLLLLGFVENVFKYGISKKYASPIYIQLKTESNRILFQTKNRIHSNSQRHNSSGIGISNAEKRLARLYGQGEYQLVIKETDGWFIVDLHLNV